MSSGEKEWLKEREAYEKELYEDFESQNANGPAFLSNGEFVQYLMSRMYHEGLPSKEPM